MLLPSLGLISHGTSSTRGRAAIRALADAASSDLRSRSLVGEVLLGHVDVEEPDVAGVLSRLPAEAPTVLVPLLLSPGYHVHVDLAEAVAAAGERTVRVTPTLGPDPRLCEVLALRLEQAAGDLRPTDRVVLAAAGSSDERANTASRRVGEDLARLLGRPVTTAFHSGAGERLSEVVPALSAEAAAESARTGEPTGRIVLASYLLAPGFFQDCAEALAADVLTAPLLLPHEEVPAPLVSIVVDRVLSAKVS